MVFAGKYPPAMPLWKEESEVNIQDTTVKVGGASVHGKLIDGVTYVPLRPLVDTLKGALTVTWTEKDGAGVEIK
jgi:hypothetical protein